MIEDFFVAIGEMAIEGICIILLLHCLYFFIVYQFVKMAVRNGVKEALAETPKQKGIDYFLMTKAVKLGVVGGLEELEERKSQNNVVLFKKDGGEVD